MRTHAWDPIYSTTRSPSSDGDGARLCISSTFASTLCQPHPGLGCHTPTLPPAHRNFHGRREPLQTEAGAAVALNDNSGSQRVTAISLSITQRAIQRQNEFNKAHRLLRRHGDEAAGASGIKGFVAPLSARALPPPFQTLLSDFNPAQPHCGGGDAVEQKLRIFFFMEGILASVVEVVRAKTCFWFIAT
ncbi:unnamed protein product [Arctogadus glacialis]